MPSTLLSTRPLRRHALVWLSRTPQPDVIGDAPDVDRWQAERHPFVVCRRRGGGDDLSLGFCLATPGRRPRRIGVQAGYDHIVRIDHPPSLEDVAAIRPDTFIRLSDAAANAGLDVRIFGSWMWQVLTGGPYVNESSDLDLLIGVEGRSEADRTVDFLERESGNCPCRLDGELSIPDLGEVHWREYLQGGAELMVKSIDGVRIFLREELWK